MTCPNILHSAPLPLSYLAASYSADWRMEHGWENLPCPECGAWGWKLPADATCADDDCEYPEPHDHGFACERSCPCALGMSRVGPGAVVAHGSTEPQEHAARWDGKSRPHLCETCGARVISRLESWVHVSTEPASRDDGHLIYDCPHDVNSLYDECAACSAHESAVPERIAPESTPDQAGSAGTENHNEQE